MKSASKGLQRLTELTKKFQLLMQKKRITKADLDEHLAESERQAFGEFLAKQINALKGNDLDEFMYKIDEVVPADTKNQVWEFNHVTITVAISKFIEEYGMMPTKSQIAQQTQLSRQTIHKHIRAYDSNPNYMEEIKKFKFMADRVLSKVFKIAISGNIKAARLYLEAVGSLNGNAGADRINNTQNNFIQINQLRISQETIKHLSPEQLSQIEAVVNEAIPVNAEKCVNKSSNQQ